jgi:hypothetical protein
LVINSKHNCILNKNRNKNKFCEKILLNYFLVLKIIRKNKVFLQMNRKQILCNFAIHTKRNYNEMQSLKHFYASIKGFVSQVFEFKEQLKK